MVLNFNLEVEMSERVYDGREHSINVECPECKKRHIQRLAYSEQGVKCPECGCVFNGVNNEI